MKKLMVFIFLAMILICTAAERADAETFIAVGGFGEVIISTDGGATWTSHLAAGGELFGVDFVGSIGWAVGGDGRIIHSADSGVTWAAQTSGVTAFLEGVSFVDANTGWTVGAGSVILHTTDSGATWNPQSQPGGLVRRLAVDFVDANNGWAVAGSGAGGTALPRSSIITTMDGGANWTLQTNPHHLSRGYADVDFIDINTGWAVGGFETIIHTSDGGANWMTQRFGTGSTPALRGVSFIDAMNGWAVGFSGIILHTSDGGATWNPQTSGTALNLNGVAFSDINTGVAVGDAGTVLYTSDGGTTWNASVGATPFTLRAVTSFTTVPTGDLVVDATTSQSLLDAITSLTGSLILVNEAGVITLIMPNFTDAGVDVLVIDNPDLVTLDLPSLTDVGGVVTVNGNTSASTIDLGALASAGGPVTVNGNTSASTIDLGALAFAGGPVTVNGNTSASTIDLGALASAGGLDITNNPLVSLIELLSLTDVGGSVSISGNNAASLLDFANLGSVGGSVSVSGNNAASSIDFANLGSAGGSVSVSGNNAASSIDFGALSTVGGNLDITNNPSANIDLASLTSVGGDVNLETQGQATVDISGAIVDGDLNINCIEATEVSANTAGGSTRTTLVNSKATMDVILPTDTFATPVGFTVTYGEHPVTYREIGEDGQGNPVELAPVACWSIAFDVPTLGQLADLTFTVDVGALSTAEWDALRYALNADSASIVAKGEEAGSICRMLPVCGPSETAAVDGCVEITRLDMNYVPLPEGSPDTPAYVEFAGVVDHFSTWGVGYISDSCIDDPAKTEPGICGCGVADTDTDNDGTPDCNDLCPDDPTTTVEPCAIAPASICSNLGNDSRPWLPDQDIFRFDGTAGEEVTVNLGADPSGTHTGERATLILKDKIRRVWFYKRDRSSLPNEITAVLPATGQYRIIAAEQPAFLPGQHFTGDYCITMESTGTAQDTLSATGWVE